ncbi:MAG TPA: hypothetical protein VMM84_12655 [Pyrinomonadaceae bacterium]|nr:hypothetical protein [Pyrinomonadaceae bacterium]
MARFTLLTVLFVPAFYLAVMTQVRSTATSLEPKSINTLANTIQGRIAISADGNEHDCDDITATAVSVALLARSGNASKLVYYGHSDHIWSTGLYGGGCAGGNRETEMELSSLETARLWGGFNESVFINAKAHTATAVSRLTAQINASTASDPLWIVGAGPMQVIGMALAASDPSRRQYVTVLSHSEWNNLHSKSPSTNENEHSHTGYSPLWVFSELGSVLGARLVQIIDQNPGLQRPQSEFYWLRDSSDPRLRRLWDRHVVSGTNANAQGFDCSDAGMIYWLITGGNNGGDQHATPAKLRAVLENSASAPAPNATFTFSLVTAPQGTPLLNITNGMTINLSSLPTRSLSINVIPSTPVGSVKIVFNGQVRTENVAPYSLAGDTDGNYTAANLGVGSHSLTVTPYSGFDLTGSAGASQTLNFTIVDAVRPPVILTQPDSDEAVALNAVTLVTDPFSVFTEHNFGPDKRTRLVLFVTNVDLFSGEDLSFVSVKTEGAIPFAVEYVGKVPNFSWLTQIKVRVPEELANAGDVRFTVSLRGLTSNPARINIK